MGVVSLEDRPLVLGLGGSPRRHGNTALLLEWFLGGAEEAGADTRTIVLNELDFRACQACGGCDETGVCVYEDGMTEVYEGVKKARGLVLASPIHFGSLSAQLKVAIDRFQCFWAARYLLPEPWIRREEGRRGFLLAAGGREKGSETYIRNAEEVAKVFFAVLNIQPAGTLFFPGLDEHGAVAREARYREGAWAAGKIFAASLLPGKHGI